MYAKALLVALALCLTACSVSDPATPAAVTSPAASQSPQQTATSTVSLADLDGQKFDLPSWGDYPAGDDFARCETVQVPLRLKSGIRITSGALIEQLIHTNLDSDPALESAALVTCRIESALSETANQILAFERGAAGQVVLLGQVTTSFNEKKALNRVATVGDEGIHVRLAFNGHCDTGPSCAATFVHYRWDGGRFVGAPATKAPVGTGDLRVSATKAVFGPAVDGKRSATLTVTVRNTGAGPSGWFAVVFHPVDGYTFAGDNVGWVGPSAYQHEPIGVGEAVTTTVMVTAQSWAQTDAPFDLFVEDLTDSDHSNNSATAGS